MENLKLLTPDQLRALSPEQIKAILSGPSMETPPEDTGSKLLGYLRANRGVWFSTLQLAKVIDPKGTTKDVNPYLYSLHKAGEIQNARQPDGSKPMWAVM